MICTLSPYLHAHEICPCTSSSPASNATLAVLAHIRQINGMRNNKSTSDVACLKALGLGLYEPSIQISSSSLWSRLLASGRFLCSKRPCQCGPLCQVTAVSRGRVPNQILLVDWIGRPGQDLACKFMRLHQRPQAEGSVVSALDATSHLFDRFDGRLTRPGNDQIDG